MLFEFKDLEEIKDQYDVLIVGGGPAALGAAVYSRRAGLSVLIVEKVLEGGQLNFTTYIDNYLGFPNIEGTELAKRMKEHAESLGTHFLNASVEKIIVEGETRAVVLDDGRTIEAKVLMIATGTDPKKLNVPGESELIGKGVSYCATCDGYFFKEKDVVVVGGGDTAINDALYLSKIARSVTVIHRRDKLRAVKILQDKAFQRPNIKFLFDSVVERFVGEKKLEKVIVRNVKTNQTSEIHVEGVFIAIGSIPRSDLVKDIVELDENGYIITNEWMETNVARLYAIGDVRKKNVRQIVTAVADGAIASVHAAENYF
ncbi:thioredoxin reductase [Pseudothermotoga hypogea DSM 11164 = NBRC 106472]|uniref:Thioredoxin reductase n=1 Tax=Pseudothermotoga hypogea DSM 11164 = NBRC 106472 TaxID=1123384 RepID=A0A0X1KTE3_9THEM|nr:thioredoxin-disulfide reductase [Pseudothermotoga hypogea]AJC74587.1 thioredoxin reductase [Pseudothermotoga hypogea DSM 11164 = NBRC 106472]MBC7122864.1 thioredoxin-disulfide reductase [Pseudothermotoga sp.]